MGVGSFLAQATPAFTVGTFIDGASMVGPIATSGGAILLAAFGAGASFRIAKKAYSWIMGKM